MTRHPYSPENQPVIGYLVHTFPQRSQTAMLNEMLELERQGICLRVFSLHQPDDAGDYDAIDALRAPVTYIPSLLPEWHQDDEGALLQAWRMWNRCQPLQTLDALQIYCDRLEERYFNTFLQGCYLALAMQTQGVQHLHVQGANVPAATAVIAQHLCGIPFSLAVHAQDIYLTEDSVLNRHMGKAQFVLTCTNDHRQYLSKISTYNTPIHVVYHGVDVDKLSPLEQPIAPADTDAEKFVLLGEDRPLRLLSVGMFCERKGFNHLIEACHLLKQMQMDFYFDLVGFGPLEEQLRDQISALDLSDQITLVGPLTQDQVIEYYRQADVFVLPCQVTASGDRDGLPDALLEAMAMGLPVITTAVSGIPELICSGDNGLLVTAQDPEEIANALVFLALNQGIRQHFGQAGQATVRQHFTLESTVAQVKDYLITALRAQTSPPPPPCFQSAPLVPAYGPLTTSPRPGRHHPACAITSPSGL